MTKILKYLFTHLQSPKAEPKTSKINDEEELKMPEEAFRKKK